MIILAVVFLVALIAFGFSLASWNVSNQQNSNIDTLAISLTAIEIVLSVLAIILGLGAIGGFWLVRQAAIDSAAREARRYIEDNAANLFDETSRTKTGNIAQQPNIPANLDQASVLNGAEEIQDE